MELTVRLVIDGVAALGTIGVAVLAIWGDKIRATLAPPKLRIDFPDCDSLRGHVARLSSPPGVTIAGGLPRVMWYTLKVVNERVWLTCHNCRVLLMGISRRGPDGVYRPESFPVPRQFWWAPSESTPREVSLGREHVFDFGFLGEQPEAVFRPTLYSEPNEFPGYVGIKDSVRYSLAITADNFHSPMYQVFEVSWDGMWSDNPDLMAKHLTIREVKDPTIAS